MQYCSLSVSASSNSRAAGSRNLPFQSDWIMCRAAKPFQCLPCIWFHVSGIILPRLFVTLVILSHVIVLKSGPLLPQGSLCSTKERHRITELRPAVKGLSTLLFIVVQQIAFNRNLITECKKIFKFTKKYTICLGAVFQIIFTLLISQIQTVKSQVTQLPTP